MAKQNFIGGKSVDAKSGATDKVVNPATGEVLDEVAASVDVDVDAAVAAAGDAFTEWSATTPRQRAEALLKIADAIEQDLDTIQRLEIDNVGKPESIIEFEMDLLLDNWRFFAGAARFLEGRAAGEYLEDHTSYVRRDALGVIGSIAPWNYPINMATWKVGPALAAGNTVVLKPAEQTPVTALELAKLIQEAGFPEGVVNIVTGYGETAGAALASHPGIDKIAFTGSTEVGKMIARAAAENLTKVSLELGGKAPNVIFADADMDQAVNGAMMGIFFNQGQVCCAGSRNFLDEKVKDEFLDRFKTRAEGVKVGNPMDKGTQMGPQVSCEQLDRIKGYVGIAKSEGATVFSGGESPELEEGFKNGYFFKPTIFSEVNNKMRVAQEEIFGPVTSVITFTDEDDLLKQANDTIYGLSAGIWTNDLARAHRFARNIKAGVIWINTFNMFNAASPFGGFKQSGYGREMGKHALQLYTQTKSVWVDLSGKPIGWFGN